MQIEAMIDQNTTISQQLSFSGTKKGRESFAET